MLSSFTLISLIGVMLGVLVLVVVMAVYAGLEKDIKERLLGFSPHVLLTHPYLGEEGSPLADWKAEAEKAKRLPFVKSALPHIADVAMLDVGGGAPRPVFFHGIETSDESQIRTLTKMLDKDHYPTSSADMGMDDAVVISSSLMNGFHQNGLEIGVGDTVRLYSTKNYEEVMRAFKSTQASLVRDEYPEEWKIIAEGLEGGWKTDGDRITFPAPKLQEIYDLLNAIRVSSIRVPEAELISQILDSMGSAELDREKEIYIFTPELKATVLGSFTTLKTHDRNDVDNNIRKNLEKFVIPKDTKILGVYRSSAQANTPDIFMPLHLAQTVAGLDNGVQGIGLRLTDAKFAEETAGYARKDLDAGWSVSTWGDQFASFFSLINQQRAMMYFVLSFIALISSFSMMAVMFTVTIQKRREIGVMKALGATPGQIVRVFLYQGMILGVIGAVLGVVLGRLIIHFLPEIQAGMRMVGFDPFSADFLGFGVLPAHNNPIEQAVFALMGFVLCSFAAVVPAFFAARSDAAKSLRNL